MNSIPANFIRALRFALKPGNWPYYVIFGICNTLGETIQFQHNMDNVMSGEAAGTPSLAASLVLAFAGLIAGAKALDNAARIRAGLADEPVPMTPLSLMTAGAVGRFFGIILLFFALLGMSAGLFGAAGVPAEFFAILMLVLGVIFLILMPAMLLCFLEYDIAKNIFKISYLREAISDIGIKRYITIIVIVFLIAFTMAVIDEKLLNPIIADKVRESIMGQLFSGKDFSLPVAFYLYNFLMGLAYAAIGSVNFAFFAWHFPRDEDNDAAEAPLTLSERARLSIQTTVAHGRTDMPGLKLTKNATAAPVAEAPLDFSVLNDADTSGMGIETQKNFVRALMRADVRFKQGDIDAGIDLLRPYTDADHDAAAYFPAYQRIYALQPNSDLLERLIAAARRGNLHSYRLIRPELNAMNPGELDADAIQPLAQLAATQHHYDTVLALTRHFAKNHPTHPHIADNYFLAARALAKTGAPDKAQQLLQQLLKRYPEHDKAGQIRHTLELMQTRRDTPH